MCLSPNDLRIVVSIIWEGRGCGRDSLVRSGLVCKCKGDVNRIEIQSVRVLPIGIEVKEPYKFKDEVYSYASFSL